jgi:hypothetical protein
LPNLFIGVLIIFNAFIQSHNTKVTFYSAALAITLNRDKAII